MKGISIIIKVLDQQRSVNQEISINCINSLLLLLSNRIVTSYQLRITILTNHVATNREEIAELENVKLLVGCLGEQNVAIQEKSLSLIHNLTVASMASNKILLFFYCFIFVINLSLENGKNSIREAGAFPFMTTFMESPKPNIRELAIKVQYQHDQFINNEFYLMTLTDPL